MAHHDKILDGKTMANAILSNVQQQFSQATPTQQPTLAIVQVGQLDASNLYIRKKIDACAKLNFAVHHLKLTETTTEEELKHTLIALNNDRSIHGILLQLPLPSHLNSSAMLAYIAPEKDVDAITPFHLGKLVQHKSIITPCTTSAVLTLLAATKIPLHKLQTSVIGASFLVGLPTAIALSPNSTVSICHRVTQDLATYVQQADVLIVAIGNPNVIQAEWIKPGTTVIDIGINRCPKGRVIGDTPFDAIVNKVRYITPVPGGVGPLTVAHMVNNLWTLYSRYHLNT